MEPAMAARAVASVKAKTAIAHHYGTFPVLTQDTNGFAVALKKRGIRLQKMAPGGSVTFDGKAVVTAGR